MENVTTLTINLDASEAVKGLKQLQREARKTVQALREVEQAYKPNRDFGAHNNKYNSYIEQIKRVVGDYYEPRYINRQLFDAIVNDEFKHVVIHYSRCSGSTISAMAAMSVFDDIVYVTRYKKWANISEAFGVEDRVFGFEDSFIRGDVKFTNANIVILDANLLRHEFESKILLRDNQRTIALYGHDYDRN